MEQLLRIRNSNVGIFKYVGGEILDKKNMRQQVLFTKHVAISSAGIKECPKGTWYTFQKTTTGKDGINEETLDYLKQGLRSITSLRLKEEIVLACRNKELTDKFYSYNKDCFDEYLKTLDYLPETEKDNRVPIYVGGKKFSVYRLLLHMARAKVGFKFNIKEYKEESKETKLTSSDYIIHDDWWITSGIIGHSKRANLSLRCTIGVDVKISDEEWKTDLKMMKSLCIIRDGVLNIKTIRIKTSDSRLTRILHKSTKCIIKEEGNEFLIDLTKLPVISRSELIKYDYRVFAYNLVMQRILKLKLGYIRGLLPTEESKKDAYGICGDLFYPTVTYKYVPDDLTISKISPKMSLPLKLSECPRDKRTKLILKELKTDLLTTTPLVLKKSIENDLLKISSMLRIMSFHTLMLKRNDVGVKNIIDSISISL